MHPQSGEICSLLKIRILYLTEKLVFYSTRIEILNTIAYFQFKFYGINPSNPCFLPC